MKIEEVAQKFQLSISTLRYYEKIGLLDHVNRDSNGHRNYSDDDLERIDFVLCMKQTGLDLMHIKEFIELNKMGIETIQQRKDILLIQKQNTIQQINQLQNSLKKLEKKLELYQQTIDKKK